MHQLWAAIVKDCRILIRDKAGLLVMFAMPILLVVVISSIQNSAFELVNENKVPLLLCNRDTGESSKQLADALTKIGMFEVSPANPALTTEQLTTLMHESDASIAVEIPEGFSRGIVAKAESVAGKALNELGVSVNTGTADTAPVVIRPVTLYYNPVLQEAFRYSVQGALRSAQQATESRQIIQSIYKALNNQSLPDTLEREILGNQGVINEVPIAKDGAQIIPNTTQHNVPAWTIFAMFFIVVSLSTNVVKEKLSGSFVRLKTLPTPYWVTLAAKQLTYLIVTLAQVLVIFSLGIFLFPAIGLPQLNLPANLLGLLLVSVMCGWCAVSYGIAVGVYAKTIEQAVAFGAVSVVILAAIGGIVVPAFAMPETLRIIMKLSPLHWCLQAYYNLFLQGGHTKEILYSILPLIVIILTMQLATLAGLKRQRLI